MSAGSNTLLQYSPCSCEVFHECRASHHAKIHTHHSQSFCLHIELTQSFPLVERSNAYVCSRQTTRIAGSNPAACTDVRLFHFLYAV
jgi:hypothetical protein